MFCPGYVRPSIPIFTNGLSGHYGNCDKTSDHLSPLIRRILLGVVFPARNMCIEGYLKPPLYCMPNWQAIVWIFYWPSQR